MGYVKHGFGSELDSRGQLRLTPVGKPREVPGRATSSTSTGAPKKNYEVRFTVTNTGTTALPRFLFHARGTDAGGESTESMSTSHGGRCAGGPPASHVLAPGQTFTACSTLTSSTPPATVAYEDDDTYDDNPVTWKVR